MRILRVPSILRLAHACEPLHMTALLVTAAVAFGCGGDKKPPVAPNNPGGGVPATMSAEVQRKFDAAMDGFVGHDKAANWNDAACAATASAFEAAVDEAPSKQLPAATYNAGLAWQRCSNDKEAKARFQKALADDPKFHYARAQLALYDFKENKDVNRAITALEQAVEDADFLNVPAFVNLALLQMQRDSATIGRNCNVGKALGDFECARLNLQRALAIDDSYMPAFNQLALYYFTAAKKRATKGTARMGRQMATNAAMQKRADVQQLELAGLVCSQAIRKNARYAPIHNTAGLILNELGQVNAAVSSFQVATSLDPRFFEAQMNLAAVNLSFRGFDKARDAYQEALKMQPNDYDAHLGLALALRGLINETNYDAQVAAVQAELDAAKRIDGPRPDAYYNEGILIQEFKAKAGGDKARTLATLKEAKRVFQLFLEKAAGKEEYAGAVKKAKERMQDIDDIVSFLEAG